MSALLLAVIFGACLYLMAWADHLAERQERKQRRVDHDL